MLDKPISPSRQRMIDDMTARRFEEPQGGGLGNPKAAEDRHFHQIQENGEGRGRREGGGHQPCGQRRHGDAADSQGRGDRKIGDGRDEEPDAGAGRPEMTAFAIGIGRGLVAEHDDHKGERLQCTYGKP